MVLLEPILGSPLEVFDVGIGSKSLVSSLRGVLREVRVFFSRPLGLSLRRSREGVLVGVLMVRVARVGSQVV